MCPQCSFINIWCYCKILPSHRTTILFSTLCYFVGFNFIEKLNFLFPFSLSSTLICIVFSYSFTVFSLSFFSIHALFIFHFSFYFPVHHFSISPSSSTHSFCSFKRCSLMCADLVKATRRGRGTDVKGKNKTQERL